MVEKNMRLFSFKTHLHRNLLSLYFNTVNIILKTECHFFLIFFSIFFQAGEEPAGCISEELDDLVISDKIVH